MLVNAWVQVITPELLGQAVECYLTPAVTSALRSDENALSALQDAMPQNGMSSPVERSSFACWFGTVPADAPAADFMAGLGRLVLGLIAFFVAGALTGGAMFFLMSWAGNHVLRTLQVEVFARLQQLSLSFYSRNESGDLMSRRGSITHSDLRGNLRIIHAQVPLAEMFGYSTVLRGLTQGRASYTMEPDVYAPVSPHLAEKIAAGEW